MATRFGWSGQGASCPVCQVLLHVDSAVKPSRWNVYFLILQFSALEFPFGSFYFLRFPVFSFIKSILSFTHLSIAVMVALKFLSAESNIGAISGSPVAVFSLEHGSGRPVSSQGR